MKPGRTWWRRRCVKRKVLKPHSLQRWTVGSDRCRAWCFCKNRFATFQLAGESALRTRNLKVTLALALEGTKVARELSGVVGSAGRFGSQNFDVQALLALLAGSDPRLTSKQNLFDFCLQCFWKKESIHLASSSGLSDPGGAASAGASPLRSLLT